MTTLFLRLSQMQATEVNAHSGFYSAGVPALTALAGMVHALQRKLNVLLESKPSDSPFDFDSSESNGLAVSVKSFVPFIQAYAYSPSVAKRSNYQNSTPATARITASMAYSPTLDLTLGLVLELTLAGTVSQQALEKLMKSAQGRGAVQSLRVAGGTMSWDGSFELAETLEDALKAVPSFAVILEDAAPDLKREMQANGQSAVAAFDKLLSRPVTPAFKQAAKAKRAKKGEASEPEAVDAGLQALAAQQLAPLKRFAAAGVGYRKLADNKLVSKVVMRSAATAGAPAATAEYDRQLVEPMLGLVRVRQAASVKKAISRGELPAVCWSQKLPTDSGIYLVSAHPAA